MTITADQLRTIVRGGLRADGSYSLPVASLGSDAATAVAEAALPGAAVTLTPDASPFTEPTDGSAVIVVSGTGVDLPFRGTRTELRVLLRDDGTAGFVLTGHPGAAWRMGAGFPPLAGTLAGTLPFAADGAPTLTLRSHPDGGPAGLSLRGGADLAAATAGLADLLSVPRLELDGTVALAKRGAALNGVVLAAPAVPRVDLGIATATDVRVSVASRLAYNSARRRWDATSFLALAMEIPFTAAGKPRSLPLRAEVGTSGRARFSADITDSVSAALDEIQELLGPGLASQVKITDHLPRDEGFDLGNVIRLNDLFVDMNLAGSPRIAMVGLGIESVGQWKLFALPGSGRVFALQNVKLLFTLGDPFGSRSPRMTVSGELEMGTAGVLELRADSGSWTVQAGLKAGTTLRLSDILQDFVGPGITVPLVLVDDFEFTLTRRTYALQVELAGHWPLDFGLFTWVINGLRLQLTNDPATTPQVLVAGSFTVAGVDLWVSAELPKAGGGWIFTGKTGADQRIPLGTLLDTVADTCGVPVPEAVRSFYLSDFDVRVETGTRAIHFGCRGGFTLADHPVELGFTLDVKPSTDATRPGFDLLVSGSMVVEGQSFTLTFAKASAAGDAALTAGTSIGDAPTAGTSGGDAPTAGASGGDAPAVGNSGDDAPTASTQGSSATTTFRGEWKAVADATGKKTTLGFGSLADLFGFEMPEIPEGLDLALDEASFTYDFSNKRLALTAHSLHYGGAVFIADASGPKARYLFALEVAPKKSLRELPVVGPAIPPSLAFSLDDISLWLASAPVAPGDVGTLDALVPAGLPRVPATGLGAGPTLSVTARLGEAVHTLTLGTAAASPAPGNARLPATASSGTQVPLTGATAQTGPAPAQAVAPQDGTTWLNLQKSIGPLSLQRIGFRYKTGRVTVLLDGGLGIAGVSFSLFGLQVSSAIKPPLNVGLGLDGLGLEVNRDPLLVSGALMRMNPPPAGMDWEYAGLARFKMGEYGIGAVGAFGSAAGVPSMFVFGVLDAPLGGDPAFFVMGLAGGLGINSHLRIPGPDEVQDFPLVAGLSDPAAAGGTGAGPLEVLRVLQGTSTTRPGPAWVSAEPGQLWVAAGLQFTSYKLVNTRALAVANLGQRDVSLALLGISSVVLPPNSPVVFARVEMQLAAVFKPMEGFLGVSAVLSRSSYLLHPSCRLTGGFAFFCWYAGEHAGDFVLSVGGYHPSFTRPAHYPALERLGFNWQVSSQVTLKGGAYFALTPSAIMAGVSLEATFHSGDLRAWFRAGADFLAHWHPFSFDAWIGVSVGASYRLDLWLTTVTVSVEIGADLHIWGPPTGGEVRVDWHVISFTIPFGSAAGSGAKSVDWKGFRELLPPDDALLTLAADGIQKTGAGEWVARPDELSFSTRSAIPASELRLAMPGGTSARHSAGSPLAIRPMNTAGVTTPKTLTVTRDGAVVDLVGEGWSVESEAQRHPEAMWGTPLGDERPRAQAAMLPAQLTGFRVRPPKARAGSTPGPVDVARDLSYEPVSTTTQLAFSPAQRGGVAAVPDAGTVAAIAAGAAGAEANGARAEVFAALEALGLAPAMAGSLAGVARDAAQIFSDTPLRATPSPASAP